MISANPNCRELVDAASDYLEEILSSVERGRLDRHVEECPGCREYLEQMRVTVQALRRLGAMDAPPGLPRLDELTTEWKRRG